jgi:branched-subunit amino acid transport protein
VTATVVLVGLTLCTYVLKAAAPLALGGRPLPEAVTRLADLLPGALLAALVVVSGVAEDAAIAVDARLVGLGAAAVALSRRAPFVVAVVAACAATALARTM